MRGIGRRALELAVLVWVCGCASVSTPAFRQPDRPVELSDTPFFAQTEYHCGPAALATMLTAEDVAVTPDQLAPLIYVPGREGSLQAEVISAARRYQRLPLRLAPEVDALITALQAGHPVLVLQNLGLRRWPLWHYAVLVGYEPQHDRFILRSGGTPREQMRAARFISSWELAGRWALVLAEPGQIPAFAQAEHWLAAAAPFESLGQLAIAERAYSAATLRWPDSSLSWQALANLRYAQSDRAGAEQALRRAIELHPQAAAARNNLASLLLERGCPTAARAQLEVLREVPVNLRAALTDTRNSIEAAASADASDCPP